MRLLLFSHTYLGPSKLQWSHLPHGFVSNLATLKIGSYPGAFLFVKTSQRAPSEKEEPHVSGLVLVFSSRGFHVFGTAKHNFPGLMCLGRSGRGARNYEIRSTHIT